MSYAELLCKSNYSFLRGASHPQELVLEAARLGLRAIGLCDVGGVYGIPKAFFALKEFPTLKLITGAEIPVEGAPPLTLLARDRAGYGLLCRILTAAHLNRPKAQPLLSGQSLSNFLTEKASEGLLGILSGHLPSLGEDSFDRWKEIFGDRLALPLFRFLDGQDEKRLHRALALQKRLDLRLFVSNDVHFHCTARSRLQDVLTSIREGVSCQDAGFKLFMNSERYLKSPCEMARLFSDLPQSLHESLRLAELCSFSPSELRYTYPSEWIPAGHTAQSYLEAEVQKGAKLRYPEGISDAVMKQLKHELALIAELKFADYFLTVYDIVDFAKKRGILCQGRGSAANSVVCYCLGVTAIDPVRMNLLFERFISVERGEPPDIDVDFEHERREEVIQYIYEKYGRDRAAMVSAVVTYKRRSAFREVAKALGVNVGNLSARAVERNFGTLTNDDVNLYGLVNDLSDQIASFPRHLSIHSGGFTLSGTKLTEIVPVEPAAMEGRTIIQWDKYDLDILGLLKVDILALGMLSALQKSLSLIGQELYELPSEDAATYAMIQRADTVGTFQIESRAQMSMLPRLLPKTFYDLVVEVAIVRPGPIVGKMVHPYLKRRRGDEPCILPDPRLEAILGRTMGVPIFQEQIMKIAITIAGFSAGEADQLRRAIGAWRSQGSIDQMGERLMKGLLKNGIPKAFADGIFQQIQGFAEYGFPESHAASFALLAYASSYIKCHYPAEFLVGLLNSQPLGFYANHTLIDDAKRHGVTVLPVHPNLSDWDSTLDELKRLRLGFSVVRGMSRNEYDFVRNEREQSFFKSFPDFLARAKLKKNIVRNLASGDAFVCFGIEARDALWALLNFEMLNPYLRSNQLQLFTDLPVSIANAHLRPQSDYEKIQADYKSFTLSVRGHPMGALRKVLKNFPQYTSADIKKAAAGSILEIAGLAIVMQRPPTAKGTVFATLEDEMGFIDLIIWKRSFEKYQELILDQPFLVVKGRLQREGNAVSMLVLAIRKFPAAQLREVEELGGDIPRLVSEGVSHYFR